MPRRCCAAMTPTATLLRIGSVPLALLNDLRGPAGDLESPEGRARERRRRVVMSAMMSMAAKIVSVGTALITVPITLHYLGTERYGMWMIMSSLVAMLSFADLGMGNGILNMVATAYGRNDMGAVRRIVSSGLMMLTLLAIVVMTGFAIAYPHVEWFKLFNVASPLARSEAGPAIAVFVAGFALAIPTGIIQRVQMGLQNGFVASMWLCGGSVLALASVLLAVHYEASLPWLVAAFLGGPIVANVLNTLVYFSGAHRDARPAISAASWETGRMVLRGGMLFLVLQVAAAVTYNSHNIIIAQILGASSVATFAVPERLFSLITMTASMALAPLWPAYRESIERGDSAWARQTLLRSLQVAIGYSAVLSIPLIFLSPWIIHHWVGGAVNPPFLLLLGLGIWKILEAGGLALGMFLNGAHEVKPQVVIATATAIVSIVTEIALVRVIGVSGAVIATLFAFTLCAVIPYTMLVPRILRKLDGSTR